MDDDDKDNVTQLPVTFRKPIDEAAFLKIVYAGRCFHGPFLVDETLEQVECQKCHEKLNPMWVLRQLASKESMFHNLHARYHDEMKRLDERQRTKCRHCGEMTRISNK